MKTRRFIALLIVLCTMLSIAIPTAFAEEKRVVTIIHHMGEQTKKDGLQAICDMVTAKMPNVTFDIQGIDYNNYAPLLKTKIAANDVPDIVFGRPASYPEIVEAGVFKDLKDFPELTGRISDWAIGGVTMNDGVYGLPIDLDIRVIYYNADMFKKYGLEIPKTKAELIKACDTFAAAGQAPWSAALNKANLISDWLYCAVVPLADGVNGNVLTDIQAGGKVDADPIFAEAVKTVNEAQLNYVTEGDWGIEENQGNLNFAAEKYPMIINGFWMLGDLMAANPNGNFTAGPYLVSDDEAKNRLSVGLDDVFMVSANTKNWDVVHAFLDAISSPEGVAAWSSYTGMMSTVQGVEYQNLNGIQEAVLPYLKDGKIAMMPSVRSFTGEFSTVLNQMLQDYGMKSAEERADYAAALATFQEGFDNIF